MGKHFNIKINGLDVSYLYIRKNACTAWKNVFINESEHQYDELKYDNPMHFMGIHHSISNKKAQKSTYRIVVLREPLGRIVSAFLNQFVDRIERPTEFHEKVVKHLGKSLENVTFRDFVNCYLIDHDPTNVDSHFWNQKSYLEDVSYNKVILLQNLYIDTKKLFGKNFADNYFKKKVNATSNKKNYEVDACDLKAGEILSNFKKGMGWPSTISFLKDQEIYNTLTFYCKEDIQLYESKLKAKVAMVVWNDFQNDARVLKEASSLIKSGYAVTVHALYDKNLTKKNEVLQTGVKVNRVKKSLISKFIAKLRNRKTFKPNAHNKKNIHLTTNVNKNISLWAHLVRFSLSLVTHARLLIAVCKYKPDIIHAHDSNTLITSWLASKYTKAKLIYDAHEISTSREGYQKIRNYVGWIEKKLMPKAVATITTTDMRAKFFARAYGVARPTVLQNRPSYYALKPSTRIRDELSLDQDWPIIVYQGGLQSGRGLERLVQAAQKVSNAYIVLIGSGRLENELKGLANDLGVSQQVKFIPVVPLAELPEYTASADIGIQPILNTCLNHYSTDSNKLFEYVLAGLPVIATDFPEIRKIVNKYQVGILADESLDGLVLAINQLVQDSQLRKQYSANALKARKELTWESQEHALVDLYNDITVTNKT